MNSRQVCRLGYRDVRAKVGDVVFCCHIYDRSAAQPHLDTVPAATREAAMNLVCDELMLHKVQFSDEQLADALDAWHRDESHYEFDEDGVSLAFFQITIETNTDSV